MARFHTTENGNIPFTPEEEAEWDLMEEAWANNESTREGDKVRAERNRLLAECDWTQLADVVLTDEAKTAWATYRQELRDITAQDGFPFDVTYPTKPVA
jgi:hypothetical protein